MIEPFPRIRIFISSPNDVNAEREAVAKVVADLNTVWSEELGLNIETIQWETHGYPAAGSDPQQILNEQLGDNYDIFIGILWSRFGTPTPRSESGTEEEFERACLSRTISASRPEIMLYFKEAPIPYTVDIEQLAKVRAFRDRNRSRLVYWSFIDTENFETLVRTHLSRALQEMAKTWRDATGNSERVATASTSMTGNLQEISELSSSESTRSTRVLERVTLLLNQMTQLMKTETLQLTTIAQNGSKPEVQAFLKRSEARVAKCMDEFAERLRFELPTFRQSRANSSRASGQVAAIVSALIPGDLAVSHLHALLRASTESEDATAKSLESLNAYQATVANMPATTEPLDRAKKNLMNALTAYQVEQTTSLRLLQQVIGSIREMVKLASASGSASTSLPAIPE